MTDDVLGFITACDICGQRVITRTQPGDDYTCPRCVFALGDLPDPRRSETTQ